MTHGYRLTVARLSLVYTTGYNSIKNSYHMLMMATNINSYMPKECTARIHFFVLPCSFVQRLF